MKNKVLSIILCCLIVIGIMPAQALAAYSDDDVPYGYTGIYTAEDLNNVRNNLSGRYALMADIDLTAATAEGGSLDCGYGWLPIGDTSSNVFSGIFLGRNHTITGLRIVGRAADYSGVFGCVTGTVKDLNLKDVNISANQCVGGIAGCLQGGTISNVHVSGLITGSYIVGGVAGILYDGNISDSSVSGQIKSSSKSAGGIVGCIQRYGSIRQCANFANVNAKSNNAGGIVGFVYTSGNNCTVEQCINLGKITAENYVGGIAGAVQGYDGGGRCYIKNCIDIGEIAGNYAGGIVGDDLNYGSFYIFSSYYLRGNAKAGTGDGSDSTTVSLSPEQMKYESNFYNFDFDNVWIIDLGSDIKRPQLRNVREAEDSGIVIEPEKHDDVLPDGYKGIYTVQDLYSVRNDLESNYILMRDIDLTEATAPGGDYDYNGQGWLPIRMDCWNLKSNGNCDYLNVGFSGVFDGNGHTISGLRIESNGSAGLFGYVEGGTIKNLTLKDVNINAGSNTGSIAAIFKRKILPECESLVNCSFSGNVKGIDNVGGLVGNYSFVYKNSSSNPAREDYFPVKYCYSNGKVEGNNNVGGLFGYLTYGAFSECYNKSNVYGLNNVGGICGSNVNRYNLSGYYYVYGASRNNNIYNLGDVYGESNVGGICGSSYSQNYITYTNCYNTGVINYLNNNYGSIVGYIDGENNKFYNCYYLKDSADTACSSTEISATVLTAEQMKQEDSFSGFDFNKTWIIDNDVDMKYPQLRNNMENPAEEISIKELPEKLTYYHHDKLDVLGLTITVKYKGLDGQSVKTVSADMVSGYDPEKVGEQTLTVNYLGAKTTFNVTVKELPVEEVIISENEMTLDIGKTATLSASVLPVNATNTSVLWSSSEPDVVRVDGNGNIAALKKGSAVITATASNGVSASCTVNVYLPAESVSLDKSELNMDRGETEILKATLKPITPSEEVSCGAEYVKPSADPAEPSEDIIWYSENTSVADVNNGVVTANGAGKTRIIVRTTRGKTASCDVNVYVSAKEVTIDPSVNTIEVIDSLQLTAKMSPSDTTDTLTWESSDESIATVSRDGVITPHKPGTVTISAKATHGAKAERTIVITGHEHTYGEAVVSIKPTCTKTGLSNSTCTKCGDVRTDVIPELGHTETAFPGIPAMCTKTGLTDGVRCSVCGEILVERKEIPSLGHKSEIIEGSPATCTQPGLTNGVKCPVCEEILIAQKRIPALGHAEETIKGKPATCTESGLSDGVKCSVCGEILTAQKEIPALGHKEVKIEGKAATCTEKGLTDGVKCSVCGEILTAQEEIPALGHKKVMIGIDSVTFSVNSDSEVDGIKLIRNGSGTTSITSSEPKIVLDESLDFETRTLTLDVSLVNADGHTTILAFVNFPADKLEFVSAKNYDGRYWMEAGQTAGSDNMVSASAIAFECFTENSIKIATFTFKVKDLGKPATCTENGFTEGTKCSVCGEILTVQKEIHALGHKEVKIDGKSATCTEKGLTDGVKCSVCGEILMAQEEIPALGPKEVKIAGKSATCTEKGLTDGTKCSVCGEILMAQEEIPALGHKEVKIEGKSATCTEKGISDGAKCSVCGEVLTAQKEIPASGHKEVKIEGKSATCTENGFTDGARCSVCDKVIKEIREIPALGHSYKDGVCTVCGAIDPEYKLILKSDSKLILLEEKALIVGTPENTNGITADEFKSQIDSDINLDMDESTAIPNGMTLKFGTHEYTVIIKGDANADSKINASDARTILRIAARLEQPDEITKEAADIDSDGKVTSAEARSVLRFAAKLQNKIYE